jgi:hypothetical protein
MGARRRGVATVRAPADLHGQRIGALRDPDGAALSVGGEPRASR